jgi:hypothetical protein
VIAADAQPRVGERRLARRHAQSVESVVVVRIPTDCREQLRFGRHQLDALV